MQSYGQIFTAMGSILLLGMLTDYLGKRTFLPRVTLLLVFGMLIGPAVLDVIPEAVINKYELLANIALVMIGFLLGGKLTRENLTEQGRGLIWISVMAALLTAFTVFIGLVLIGIELNIAILLGAIASATAPAATVDIIEEMKIGNPFSAALLSIVALDDAWALIIFSLAMAVVATLNQVGGSESFIFHAARELGGAIILGLCLGLPAAYLTGRIRKGEPMLVEALALVFLCAGLAIWLEVSYLIAAMVMGATIANLAHHHEYPFHAIRDIEWPFMILFFVLAGTLLEFSSLGGIGLVGLIYIICRIVGKTTGAAFGGYVSGADYFTRKWMGIALLPQAGAAMGMALIATNYFPQYRDTILAVVIGTTIFFELVGPVMSRLALRQSQGISY